MPQEIICADDVSAKATANEVKLKKDEADLKSKQEKESAELLSKRKKQSLLMMLISSLVTSPVQVNRKVKSLLQ